MKKIFVSCILLVAVWSFTVAAERSSASSQKGKENFAVADFAGKNVSQADASIVADFVSNGTCKYRSV